MIGFVWIVGCPWFVVKGDWNGKIKKKDKLCFAILQFVTLVLFIVTQALAKEWRDWFVWVLLGQMGIAIVLTIMLYAWRKMLAKKCRETNSVRSP